MVPGEPQQVRGEVKVSGERSEAQEGHGASFLLNPFFKHPLV